MKIIYSILFLLVIGMNTEAQEQFQEIQTTNSSSNFFGGSLSLTDDGEWLSTSFRRLNTASNVEIYRMINGEYVFQTTLNTTFEISETDFSTNATRIMVGHGLGNIFRKSHLEVYERSGSSWSKIGQTIISENSNTQSGTGVDMSSDGYTMAIGDPTTNSGTVEVYTYNGSSWVSKGQVLNGTPSDFFGTKVALSPDGNRLAVALGISFDQIKIYDYLNGTWVLDSSTINTQGGRVEFDGTGDRILCGQLNTGKSNVYEKVNNSWIKIGGDIIPYNANSNFWNAIDLDFAVDGNRFAMTLLNGSNQRMKVAVFDLIGSSWQERRNDFYDAENSGYFGSKSQLSSDGETLILSDGRFDGNTGRVVCYIDDENSSSIDLDLRVYLEGSLSQNNNDTDDNGNPLMRDNLRISPFTGLNYIPAEDPYTYPSSDSDMTFENFTKVGPGLLITNTIISDPDAVFGVSGEDAIVDWVFVELRDKDDYNQVIATRSGLVQRDGDIVDLDGESLLEFQDVNSDNYYVTVRHRNHLGTMSMLVSSEDQVDFTSLNTPLFTFGMDVNMGVNYNGLEQNEGVKSGYRALWVGDFNSDGVIKFTEPASDHNVLFGEVLFNSAEFMINSVDVYGYYNGDVNMNSNAKYTNPNDDLNYLFGQILFYRENNSFRSNYSMFKQQIPE